METHSPAHLASSLAEHDFLFCRFLISLLILHTLSFFALMLGYSFTVEIMKPRYSILWAGSRHDLSEFMCRPRSSSVEQCLCDL